MPRYIDVDKIEYTEQYLSGGFVPTVFVTKSDIDKMPVVETDGFKEIFEAYKSLTYICSVCGDLIFPEIDFQDDKINMTTEKCDIRGGKGNHIRKENVCKRCRDSMKL